MRRGNGTGSVYKLSGKRRKPWVAAAPAIFDDNGKTIRPIIGYFSSRTAADKALTDYVQAPYDAQAAATATFGDMFDEWYKRAIVGKSKPTIGGYNINRKRFEPLMGTRMRDIRYKELQEFMDGFSEMSYSARVKIAHGLREVFETAIKMEIVTKNYAEQLDYGKAEKSDIHRVYSEKEIKALWERRNDISCANALVLCYTGLRPDEAIKQPITDDDRARGWFIAIGNKTENSKGRLIPIHPALKEILSKRKWLIEDDKHGFPTTYKRLRADIKSHGHLPHDGRHTLATLLRRYHADAFAQKKLLGHAIGNVTDGTYTHLDYDAEFLTAELIKVPRPEQLHAEKE